MIEPFEPGNGKNVETLFVMPPQGLAGNMRLPMFRSERQRRFGGMAVEVVAPALGRPAARYGDSARAVVTQRVALLCAGTLPAFPTRLLLAALAFRAMAGICLE